MANELGELIKSRKKNIMLNVAVSVAADEIKKLQQENAELRDCIAKNEQFVTWLIENLHQDVLDDINPELSEVTMRNMKLLNKND